MNSPELKLRVGQWAAKNFDYHAPQLGIAEEIGELVHTVLKRNQGIRFKDGSSYEERIKDAIADARVFLAHLEYLRENDDQAIDDSAENNMLGALVIAAGRLMIEPKSEILFRLFEHKLMVIAEHFELEHPVKLASEVFEKEVEPRDWRKYPKTGVPEKPKSYTIEEYSPEIKRKKAVGEEVELGLCDNCHQKTLLPDGICMQCGHSPRIGNGPGGDGNFYE